MNDLELTEGREGCEERKRLSKWTRTRSPLSRISLTILC